MNLFYKKLDTEFLRQGVVAYNTGLKVILFYGGGVGFRIGLQEMKFIVYLTRQASKPLAKQNYF
jgi:hypothetical protein